MFKYFLLIVLLSGSLFAPLPAAALPPNESASLLRSSTACGYNADIAVMLGLVSASDWAGWIARLSGAADVSVNGTNTRILTRFSHAMFANPPTSAGYTYVRQKLLEWYPQALVQDETYSTYGLTWKNLVLTLPGTTRAAETVLLSAHLDSYNLYGSMQIAPGAEDNASGSAALLEAARIFRTMQFERTLRLVWFTGEEQGMIGSKAYVAVHNLSDIAGVINLDMYGYDADDDGCFELHAGTLPASAPISACFSANVQAYSPTLKVDLIDTYNLNASDHASFWDKGIGAVEVLENDSYGPEDDACGGIGDPNPWYHTGEDTLEKINLKSGLAITHSALATAANMARPIGPYFSARPNLQLASPNDGEHILSWNALEGAQAYRIYRSPDGCSGDWQVLLETSSLSWTDNSDLNPAMPYAYRVEALSPNGIGASAPSACIRVIGSLRQQYLPWISD